MKKVILVCVGLMLLAGCEQSDSPNTDQSEEIVRLKELAYQLEVGVSAARYKVAICLDKIDIQEGQIRDLTTELELAGATPTSNIALLLRVNSLETKNELYGNYWMESKARIKNLEASEINAYDPNDQALRYLPKPPTEWTKEHGDSERSLLLYNLAATSVIAKEALRTVGVVSRCVVKVHPSFVVTKDGTEIMDPNNYVEPPEPPRTVHVMTEGKK